MRTVSSVYLLSLGLALGSEDEEKWMYLSVEMMTAVVSMRC
jgi:hypothetical protein